MLDMSMIPHVGTEEGGENDHEDSFGYTLEESLPVLAPAPQETHADGLVVKVITAGRTLSFSQDISLLFLSYTWSISLGIMSCFFLDVPNVLA